jgi:error-prone DNA polymerase
MAAAAPYVELHAHSAFSFLDGASTPAELASAAAELGYQALALTDHDGVWGSMELVQACKEIEACGEPAPRPITGAEVTVRTSSAGCAHLTLLVQDATGYRNLCRLLTAAHSHTRDSSQRSAGQPSVTLEQVEEHAAGLVCLSGCAGAGMLAAAWERGDAAAGAEAARRLLSAFGRDRFRVELQRPFWRRDRSRNRWLAGLAERLGVPAVATGNVHSHTKRRADLQDTFVATRLGMTLEESESLRRGNRSSALRSPRAMAECFAEHPDAVAETLRIAERLEFDLSRELGYRYPRAEEPGVDRKLAELCRSLLAERYAGSRHRLKAERQLGQELETIRALGLSGFFLLHHDLLVLAREVAAEVRGPDSARSILPPGRGRGSSVSSIVCYLTGLSHIDPVANDLNSSRFLNEEVGKQVGATMPDIDLDFPRDIREVLIPRVHERYGAEHSALVAAFPTYRPRAAVRDLGKALGLPAAEIDQVAKMVGFHERSGEIEKDVIAAIGAERAAVPRWRALLQLCPEAMGLPRHASQHPGGMVISTRPLIDVCPVVPAAMEGRQIVQWDKDSCNDAGLLKIDLLGLGMLSAVERCVDEVRETRREALDLSRIPFDDAETFRSIRAAETTGVFQIESRAQMSMLPRTRPENLDDLTVQVALVRPGPIQGGAVHPYIERLKRRREDPGFEAPYEHPLLKGVLEYTLGTIIFQEQVIEVAIALASFTAAQADSLRRAMSRKRSVEEMERHHENFIAGAVEKKDVPEAVAEKVWQQIKGFSGFGFPKAHSAAFGLLAYQSAWLRVHRSQEFLCALLNEQPMGFYPPDALVHEAQRRGVLVVGPDVNRSRVLCHVEPIEGELTVRIGLGYVKGARKDEAESLVAERERSGDYAGIADLASRSGAGRDGLERLAWAGALDSLVQGVRLKGVSALPDQVESAATSLSGRREALWEAGGASTGARRGSDLQMALPLEPPRSPELKPLGDWERLIANYHSIGMTLDAHPLGLMRDDLDDEVKSSADLERADNGVTVSLAGFVVARQRPETANGIVFMLLEDELGTVNLIVPPAVYERCRAAVRAAPLVRALGRLERHEGTTNIVVSEVTELEIPKASAQLGRDGDDPESQRPSNHPTLSRRPGTTRQRLREHAVTELRAAVPEAHSWGRRR